MIVGDPQLFQRLDRALEAKVREVVRSWVADDTGFLIMPLLPSAHAQIVGRVRISGAIWN